MYKHSIYNKHKFNISSSPRYLFLSIRDFHFTFGYSPSPYFQGSHHYL